MAEAEAENRCHDEGGGGEGAGVGTPRAAVVPPQKTLRMTHQAELSCACGPDEMGAFHACKSRTRLGINGKEAPPVGVRCST